MNVADSVYTQAQLLCPTCPMIPGQIRAHQLAGRCACEIHNPQGACCLGNVTRFRKQQLREQEK